MTPERWRRIEAVFEEATAAPEEERAAVLDRSCEGDAPLRSEVEKLLVADAATSPITRTVRKAAVQAGASALAGKRLGPYLVVRELGQGGMGAVYLATRDDDAYRKEVAVKVIQHGLDTDAALARFRRERQILAGLEHPNVARLLDGGSTESGLPYLVMEYVRGRPFLEHAADLGLDAKLALFLDVAGAVEYAHQNLVVHRDIKPANILVTADGTPKLLDFGIAKLLADDGAELEAPTRTRAFTPEYASPEQVRGETATAATDVHALGNVLYEMLSGVRAQQLKSFELAELLRVVCEQNPPPPSAVAPSPAARAIRGDLDTIVMKAIQKDPARRYRSVAALAEDVRRYLGRLPVLARKDTALYRSSKFVRRNRVAVALGVLLIVGLSCALAESIREARRAQRRYEDVRALSQSFLFEFHDAIIALPGSTPARELVVRRAQEYLDKLATEDTSDPTLMTDLAAAYVKLGDVQGAPGGANLGHFDDALANYGRARALLDRVPKPQPRAIALAVQLESNSANILSRTARYDESRERFRRAIEAARPLRSVDGPDRFLEVNAWIGLNFLGRRMGKTEDAIAASRGAVEAASAIARVTPEDPQALFWLAKSRSSLANVSVKNLDEALSLFAEAVRNIDKARELAPNDVRISRQACVIGEAFATALGDPYAINAHDTEAARRAVEPAIARSRSIYESDPRSSRAAIDLAWFLRAEGDIASVDDPAASLAHYDEAIRVLTDRVEQLDQNDAGDLALIRARSAHPLVGLARAEEAIARVHKAIDDKRALIDKSSDPLLGGYALELSEALRLLAEAEEAASHPSETDKALDEALAVAGRVLEARPRAPEALAALARVHEARGDALGARAGTAKNADERTALAARAKRSYEASLALWRRWTDLAPDGAFNRNERERVEKALARVVVE